jgi:hypothetical protein
MRESVALDGKITKTNGQVLGYVERISDSFLS